jgi:hypothetical protein
MFLIFSAECDLKVIFLLRFSNRPLEYLFFKNFQSLNAINKRHSNATTIVSTRATKVTLGLPKRAINEIQEPCRST